MSWTDRVLGRNTGEPPAHPSLSVPLLQGLDPSQQGSLGAKATNGSPWPFDATEGSGRGGRGRREAALASAAAAAAGAPGVGTGESSADSGSPTGVSLANVVALLAGKPSMATDDKTGDEPGRPPEGGGGWAEPTRWLPHQLLQDDSHSSKVLVALLVASVNAILVCAYFLLLESSLDVVWKRFPEAIFGGPLKHHAKWTEYAFLISMVTTFGVLVGCCLKFFPYPGDLPFMVHCVHNTFYIPFRHFLPMLVVSLLSIVGGASVGPEAAIVLLCGSIGGKIGRLLGHKRRQLRSTTLYGMACGSAAFFGSPLGGSLFALEVLHLMGMEYYEDATYAILSGTVCCILYHWGMSLPLGGIWDFPVQVSQPTVYNLLLGIPLGIIGALAAWVFLRMHRLIGAAVQHLHLEKSLLTLSTVSAFLIGAMGLVIPEVLFWGESEIKTIVHRGTVPLPHIFPKSHIVNYTLTDAGPNAAIAVAKMATISLSLHGGFRGGVIFPFFLVGAAVGSALQALIPSIDFAVATMGVACAMNVAVMRTAWASALILSSLSGEVKVLQSCVVAGLVSLLVTNSPQFHLIKPQRPRAVPNPNQDEEQGPAEVYNPSQGE